MLLALTEIALEAYDREAGIPSHRDVLRFQASSEVRYLAPLRWDDAAIVRMRCSELRPGRLTFNCEVAAESSGQPVARMTHRYAYVNAQSGRAETPRRLAGDRRGDPRLRTRRRDRRVATCPTRRRPPHAR